MRRPIRVERGRAGERLARQLLEREGFQIEAANVRFPVGEIDLVAREGATLCFVEVRSSRSEKFGGAISSITDRKRHHLIRAAQWYLKRLRDVPDAVRFDVVVIEQEGDEAPRLELIRSAFDASGYW